MSAQPHIKELMAIPLSPRSVTARKHAAMRGAVMVEAAVAAPLLIGLLMITVWFSTLYTAKIDSVVTARAKTMAFASGGCKVAPTSTDSATNPTMAEWNSTTTVGGVAQEAIAAATVKGIAGCSDEAKKYNVAMVTVSKTSRMPIGTNRTTTDGYLGIKTFKSTSYALCNPTAQTSDGLATMGKSVGTLLTQIMGN